MREPHPDDMVDWSDPADELRFAFGLGASDRPASPVAHEISLTIRGIPPASTFSARSDRGDVVASAFVVQPDERGWVDLRFVVEAPAPEGDDELALELVAEGSAVARSIRIRRTRCLVETALIHPRSGAGGGQLPLGEHVRAALLWYGWNRCTRLVGIKRFDVGLSGSEVFVFRPRLAVPRLRPGEHAAEDFAGCSPPDLWSESWGTWMLVKAGGDRQLRKEWSRHDVFLRDRLSPFMARAETLLHVRPAGRLVDPPGRPPGRVKAGGAEESGDSRGRSTMISSFLGGDLIRAEPLEYRLRSGDDPASCRGVIARVFETLAVWHHSGRVGEIGEFRRFFKAHGDVLYLFGPKVRFPDGREEIAYDLTRRHHRELLGANTTWDVAFQRAEHLEGHLLGTANRVGLLRRVMATKVRHSMIHGDLNPRNVLCDRDYAWLIDFEHAGYGPTLHDFAWLEVNLRYFCLALDQVGESLDEAATRFERHLLDHLHGSESSLEPIRQWAAELGADPDQLYKLAAAIVQVRQLALPFCVDEYADHRDYLGVLYLAVLSLLRGDRPMTAPPANYRALVRLAWVLEEQLSRIHGLVPYDPHRTTPDLKNLIGAEWLRADGAPGRVAYLADTADGVRALGPVAAMRGVQQGEHHHLDVFDHTLSVLAYTEALLGSPDLLAGFLDPGALDASVGRRLDEQGLRFPPGVSAPGGPLDTAALGQEVLDAARAALRDALDDESRLLLKWCALLHDVGKPGVRSMTPDGQLNVIGHPEYGLQLLADHLPRWFDAGRAERLRHLILRHHDHNNLAKEDHKAVERLDGLRGLVIDPRGVSYREFDDLWPLVEAVVTRKVVAGPDGRESREMRRDFPLLLMHGYADSLASRGRNCPISPARRSEIYLTFLAIWHRRPDLAALHDQWQLCRERTTRDANPALHALIFDQARAVRSRPRILGQLPEWAWGRVRSAGVCPSPEEFVAQAGHLLDPIADRAPAGDEART